MEGTYPVMLGGEQVGEVIIKQVGLYYQFSCQCKIHSQMICRVTVSCGGHHENLGILLPAGDKFWLNKRIPAKNFPNDKPSFWITPKHDQRQGRFVDVYPEEPFAYIAKLENACLEKRRGRSGIFINNH